MTTLILSTLIAITSFETISWYRHRKIFPLMNGIKQNLESFIKNERYNTIKMDKLTAIIRDQEERLRRLESIELKKSKDESN